MDNTTTTPTPLEKGTLNLLTGGPSAGKTTLIYQAIAAHELNQPFFVPCLKFPDGPILVVNTDRSADKNRRFFAAIGITQTLFISLVDDRVLSNLSTARALRQAVTDRIAKLANKPTTLVLDLYNDFLDAKMNESKKLAQDGRANVQWAQDLDLTILGLTYPYKQKSNNRAVRLQDRVAGALTLQASADWKFVISDRAETGSHWIVDGVPGPMGGPPQTFHLTRQDDEDGVGRFMPTLPPDASMTIKEIMNLYNVKQRQAYNIRAELRREAGLAPLEEDE